MGYISRIQAINEMLLAAGEDLVSDLDESSGVDTSIAEFILDRVTEEFQLRGIASNTYVQKIKPDSSGKIHMPNDMISVRLLSSHTSDDSARGFDGFNIEAAVRGEPNAYLFNVTEQTSVWKSEEYTLEFIQKIRWEDMDTSIQKGIIASSGRWYQMITQGDDAADNYLASKEIFLLSKGKAADINRKGRTIFQGDLGRRSLRNRGNTTRSPERVRYWNFSTGG
jgi:hypothetical protein